MPWKRSSTTVRSSEVRFAFLLRASSSETRYRFRFFKNLIDRKRPRGFVEEKQRVQQRDRGGKRRGERRKRLWCGERRKSEKLAESGEEDESIGSGFGSDSTHNPLPIHLVSAQWAPRPRSSRQPSVDPIHLQHETQAQHPRQRPEPAPRLEREMWRVRLPCWHVLRLQADTLVSRGLNGSAPQLRIPVN